MRTALWAVLTVLATSSTLAAPIDGRAPNPFGTTPDDLVFREVADDKRAELNLGAHAGSLLAGKRGWDGDHGGSSHGGHNDNDNDSDDEDCDCEDKPTTTSTPCPESLSL
jgi:hypothetical protein